MDTLSSTSSTKSNQRPDGQTTWDKQKSDQTQTPSTGMPGPGSGRVEQGECRHEQGRWVGGGGGVGGFSGMHVVAPYVHVGSNMRASLLRPFITAHMFYDSLYGVLLRFPWRLHTVPPGHQHDREVPCCRITLLCLTTMMAVQ